MGFSRQEYWSGLPFPLDCQPRDQTQVSHIAGRCFTLWTTRGAQTSIAFVVALQSLSHLTLIPWTAACQASLSFTTSWSLLKLKHIHWVSDAIQPSSSAIPFSFCPQPFPASGSFPESQLLASMAKVLEIHFIRSISPPNEYSGLISFRIGWFDLLAIQGTLKSLLQHHSSKA